MGGEVLLLINPSLSPRASGATSDILISDAFNVVAAVIGSSHEPTTIITVYRPPWASREDAENLIRLLEHIVCGSHSFIILGDFNLPHISWNSLQTASSDGIHDKFLAFFMQERLTQMIRKPTRHKAILDIILVPDNLLTSPPKMWCHLSAVQTMQRRQ